MRNNQLKVRLSDAELKQLDKIAREISKETGLETDRSKAVRYLIFQDAKLESWVKKKGDYKF